MKDKKKIVNVIMVIIVIYLIMSGQAFWEVMLEVFLVD